MKVLYVSTVFPSLTMTFVYREVAELERHGCEITTVSMNAPSSDKVSLEARRFVGSTIYLDQAGIGARLSAAAELLFKKPWIIFRCLALVISYRPMNLFYDGPRLASHFLSAAYLSKAVKARAIEHIHSHFISGPTNIGMFISAITGIPFSFTMHASNIWLYPGGLVTKLRRCRFAVSISKYNRNYIAQEYGEALAAKIGVVHCGIDLTEFVPLMNGESARSAVPLIVSVGQLVPRKGFDILIKACAILKKRGYSFFCQIIGGGPLMDELQAMIRIHDLCECVELAGPKFQEDTRASMQKADIFCLPCRILEHGGRDGIPVVLMEAMALEKFVVSTNVVGIPELIQNGENGLLVEPESSEAIAAALQVYLDDPSAAVKMRQAARRKIAQDFELRKCVEKLLTMLSVDEYFDED